ncbi:hypothetical protein E6C27_scaffold238G001190 [Cucumis melo var. makuwa]|uniref:DUF7746 domain-containing protein n=1 Tax=Cucumis melo var. makuwa TaxID=1194695 RepID=A0A5A7VII9_CUCMM|nr:hypothetical protein E6C27_scaffold238G001190 [Cucumis melo var. makuwa]
MKLDKKETLTPSERSGLPRVDPNRPIMQPNSLDIKLKGSSTDELLEELTRKLSETSISKENIGTSSKREVSNFGMGNLNTISYDSLKILPIKVYNTNMKNHYKKPSPPDLGWDDLRPDFRSFDKNNIETWNIDGCSEGQMAIIFQEMFVAATSYLRRMSQREIVDALTTGFTGNLRSPNGDVVTIQPNSVNTLVYAANKHFVGRTTLYSDQSMEALLGMKCPKVSDFKCRSTLQRLQRTQIIEGWDPFASNMELTTLLLERRVVLRKSLEGVRRVNHMGTLIAKESIMAKGSITRPTSELHQSWIVSNSVVTADSAREIWIDLQESRLPSPPISIPLPFSTPCTTAFISASYDVSRVIATRRHPAMAHLWPFFFFVSRARPTVDCLCLGRVVSAIVHLVIDKGVREVTLKFWGFTASVVGANSPLLGWIRLDVELSKDFSYISGVPVMELCRGGTKSLETSCVDCVYAVEL